MVESMTLSSGKSVTSPFNWGGASYPLTDLDAEEQDTFRTEFEGLLGTQDSVIRNLFRDRKDFMEIGVMAIKQALNDPRFEGIYPSDPGMGISLIRPMHVGDTSNAGKTSWSETIATANTRQAWIGTSSSSPFTVGGYTSDASAGWGGVIIIGVASLSLTQVVNEIKFWNDRNERVPVNVEDIGLGDNTNQVPVYPVPTELYLPKTSMYAELNGVTTSAVEYFKVIGLACGLGKLLKRTTYA